MYEDQNYLTIMERILGRTPQDLDKSEGSLLWETIGPDALEFELIYLAIDRLIKNAYPTSAEREWLIKWADIFNLIPYEASRAVLKAEFIFSNDDYVSLGERFSIDGLFYTVIGRETETEYKIECETPGTIGNKYYGQLLPARTRRNFVSAQIKELLIPGEDVEPTEEFRARVKRYFLSQAYGWNEAEYIEEVTALQGVADCKILRCPRGKGTVDVIIIDTTYRRPSDEQIRKVQEALRPLDITGPPEIHNCGLGKVAIGHETLVFGVREREIEIGLELELDKSYTFEGLKETIESEMSKYLLELAMDWGDKNYYLNPDRKHPKDRHLKVQLSKIEQRLFNIEGIDDYNRYATSINGIYDDLELEWDEIPVLKGVVKGKPGGTGEGDNCKCNHNCAECPYRGVCSEIN